MTQSSPQGAPSKVLVMTGGTSGIGRRALELLLASDPDWRVLLLARCSSHADQLVSAFGPDRLRLVHADLADLDAVADAADRVREILGGGHIDAVACNAGVQAILGDRQSLDSFEYCFAVNHLAHFLLVERLLPLMRYGGRIVVTTSEVHDPHAFCMVGITRAVWEDPLIAADPRRSQAIYPETVDRGEARYCASKLFNLMHVRHLAASAPHISAIGFNPSVVPGTEIARDRSLLQILGWKYVLPLLTPVLPWARSMGQSASDLAWLLTAADASSLSGQYINGRAIEPGSPDSRDLAKIARLVSVSRQLIAESLGAHEVTTAPLDDGYAPGPPSAA